MVHFIFADSWCRLFFWLEATVGVKLVGGDTFALSQHHLGGFHGLVFSWSWIFVVIIHYTGILAAHLVAETLAFGHGL